MTASQAVASHGSLKTYTVGLTLSMLLTLASFGAVMLDVLPRQMRLLVIVTLCIAQLLVQLISFTWEVRRARAPTPAFSSARRS